MKETIRPSKEDDLEEILDLINSTNRQFYKRIVSPHGFKDPFMSQKELENEAYQKDFYVYEAQDRIVGVTAFEVFEIASQHPFDKVGVVTRMYVLPKFQRQGIGAELMSTVERKAKKNGIRKMVIWTDPLASWAVSFYKRLGYSEIDPADNYGNETIDDKIRKHGKELLVLQKKL
jgi:N-acetylglutamate synthase-like GNAT family acetyltransferase